MHSINSMTTSNSKIKYPIAWPAAYTDANRTETTVILFDGHHLRMTVRGVGFIGDDFDCFEPQITIIDDNLKLFTCAHSWTRRAELSECRIECDIPMVMVGSTSPIAELHVILDLGHVMERGMLDREDLKLSLCVDGITYQSIGKSGWFEDEKITETHLCPEFERRRPGTGYRG